MKTTTEIKLTQTVQKGGCAAKIAATELRKILSMVRFPQPHQELMVDGRHFDDAAVYKVSPELALVQTLDFFTPIVDSPNLFGRIAAANALSDVYAMGAEPKTAMGILAFPLDQLSAEVITAVMQGACDICSEAQVNLVGGHSIDDDTLKFGLSVTGYVHPERVWANTGAKVGDVLILTKALGTGTVTAGLKRKELTEESMKDVLFSMAQLNRISHLLSPTQMGQVHAATDITGFGILGHAMQMALASQVSLSLFDESMPIFPLALDCLKKGFLTKAHRTNANYTEDKVLFLKAFESDAHRKLIYFDPQTSGGLLLSVSAAHATEMLNSLQAGFPQARIIGRVEDQGQKSVTVL